MNQILFNRTYVKRLLLSVVVNFTTERMAEMKDCADFLPSPTPSIEDMGKLRDAFLEKQGEYKANPSELNKQVRDAAYSNLIQGHLDWIAYAEPLIGNDEDKAARLGYPKYANRTGAIVPIGVPDKPKIELTPNPGEVFLIAKAYKQGSKIIYYNWQMSEDGKATYQYLPVSGSSHRRRIKLELGKTYFFRVAYATSAGEGLFSDWLEVALTRDMVVKEERKKAA